MHAGNGVHFFCFFGKAPSTPRSFQHGKQPPAAYFFLTCQKKVCKKRDAADANSAYAPEHLTFGLFSWLVSLPRSIETAEKKRAKPENTAWIQSKHFSILQAQIFAAADFWTAEILRSVRRAFLDGGAIDEWQAEEKCFFRRDSAISRPNGLFFHLFSAKTEKMWPSETPYAIPALYFTLFSVG